MNRFLYTLLLFIALPLVPLKLLWRSIKQPVYLQHWAERFGFYTTKINKPQNKPIVWLHCVSVGETRAAAPLINALQTQYPQYQILITHGTPTGRSAGEDIFGNLLERVYLPYDVPFAVDNFLKHFKPKIGLIMETELWFNLIAACKKCNVPLLLLNARLSEKSLNGYAKLGKLAQQGIHNLSAIAAQTADDATRFANLGAKNISIAGNLKFDVKVPDCAFTEGIKMREQLGKKDFANKTVFLAASTRDGEEELIIEAVRDLDITTIIVPRHPQRFNEVANLLQKQQLRFVWRTDLQGADLQKNEYPDSRGKITVKTLPNNCNFVLGNSMGEMFTYYAACDFCFIGGSLLPFGGQNLIEAAQMGKPIIIGEHTFNFANAADNAVEMGAALRVADVNALRTQITKLHDDAQLRQKMQQNALTFSQTYTGATARLMQIIAQYLP